MRPNLVLVVFDTARADRLDPVRSPAIRDVASRGRWFSRAVSPAPWTLPSHASIFTGERPSEHGVTGAAVMTSAGPRSTRPLIEAKQASWLPERLRRLGYRTFGSSANAWVGPSFGFDRGFEEFHESWRDARLPKLGSPLDHGDGPRPAARYAHAARVHARRALGRGDSGAISTLETFARFLDRGRMPFFAFMNVMEAHAPYVPPAGFGPGGRRRIEALWAVRRWSADRMLLYCLGRDEIAPRELELLRAMYDAELGYCDRVLTWLLEALDRRRLLEETVVVATSDHGEHLGEHHRLSHVMSMREPLVHVPLAVAGPGVPAGREDAPVGLLSLSSLLTGLGDGRWVPPDPALAVSEYESASNQITARQRIEDRFGDLSDAARREVRARWVAAYEGRFKYVASSEGSEALYDLVADPAESTDVRSQHPDVVARLASRRGVWAGGEELAGDRLEDEIVSHLQGLGYL